MSPKIVDVDATLDGYEESRDQIQARRLERPADYLLNLYDNLEGLALVIKTLDDLHVRLLNGYLSRRIIEDPILLERLNDESRLFYYGRRLLPDLIELSDQLAAIVDDDRLPGYSGLHETLSRLVGEVMSYRENLGAGPGTAPAGGEELNLGTVIQKAADDERFPNISLSEMVETILSGGFFQLSEAIQAMTGRAKQQAEAAALLGADLSPADDNAYAAAGTSREQLFTNLSEYFARDDLLNLAFKLELDHDELPSKKSPLIRDLILACEQRDLLSELVRMMSADRPNLEW